MKKRSSAKASTTNRKPVRATNAKSGKVSEKRPEKLPETRGRRAAAGAAGRGLAGAQRKVPIALRVDGDVLAWFKAQGPGYQTRINAVLRAFMDKAR